VDSAQFLIICYPFHPVYKHHILKILFLQKFKTENLGRNPESALRKEVSWAGRVEKALASLNLQVLQNKQQGSNRTHKFTCTVAFLGTPREIF